MRIVAAQLSESELFAPLAAVVGSNCRRIRKEIRATQDDLARHLRSIGLDWTETRVGHFEAGRSAPTFATVLLVSLALQHAAQAATNKRDSEMSDAGVTLADLVGSEGWVGLHSELALPAEQVSAVCKGKPWETGKDEFSRESEDSLNEARAKLFRNLRTASPTDRVLLRSGLAEDRLARRLEISRTRLAQVSFRLWESTFSEERDRRAGHSANQQKRGRTSRELRAELEKALADGDDQ